MARSRKMRTRQTRRKHRGGGTYSYTGPAGVAAGGVPFESRVSVDDHCSWGYRQPPQRGGRLRGGRLRGGSCGCGRQIGGSNGGYGFDFGNNALGKVYSALPVGACPPAPVARQLGGASDHELEISSYPSGYGFGPAGVMSTDSSHYLDPSRYNRACMGGAKRKTHRKK